MAPADPLGEPAGKFDSAQVRETLAALAERWPEGAPSLGELLAHFPLGEEAVRHLFAVSSICRARLLQEPEVLLWLADPEVATEGRGHRRMLSDLRRLAGSQPIAANNFRVLRRWKGREMVRIALREVAEAAPLEETLTELSQLADICLTTVFDHWNEEFRRRWGSPASEMTIFGLGKLGGRELNHSSDVDLIFVYGEEGQLTANFSYHQWFTRLGNKIIETFAISDPAGSLFRVDLRLRPEGSVGPLVRSLESMENYYAGFGETWERLALIKARWICGDRELAYEFLRQHQPFIFPKNPTPDLLEEIALIKRRIERDIVGHEHLERNVKLGVGGIREIEFVVQALQLLHAARHPFLQETSTLKSLRGIAQLEFLPEEDAAKLEAAYRFFRRVEHRLQIEAEQQTHTVPEPGEALQLLASSLGFNDESALLAALHGQMQTVRAIFERVVGAAPPNESVTPDFSIFHDRPRAEKMMEQLARGASGFHVAPRTRQIYRRLRPLLLSSLAQTADPDGALNQFTRFVEAYGLRSLLFELLVTNPRLLELLTRTFDASEAAGTLLIRRPQLLEELTRSGTLDGSRDVSLHRQRLESLGATSLALDPVRNYRRRELLRILLREVLELAPLPTLLAEQCDLAEACLLFVHKLLQPNDDLTIIALGKFGGREIGYGADLDVMFVGNDARAAQQLIGELALSTAEGSLAMIDPRLRPEGEKGPLVSSLETLRAYYEKRAQFWELQALTRARPLTGRLGPEFLALAQEVWRAAGRRPDLVRQIENMLARIANDRGSGNDFYDFKTGIGGMIEAEFLIQGLQMRHGIWEPNFRAAVEKLTTAEILPQTDGASLRSAYDFLRACESVLRRWQNRSVSKLPATRAEEDFFARRMKIRSIEEFRLPYGRAREVIHSLRLRYLVD
ncbi:MAG: bifunctional [glutamate--ammonia ligase]-adenylyl-L-tyrosine phosphorylase/[glutamate--ammonia-ligase] adenylyltransferase [Chthoniobacterales bacterium]|nr:bifunctional [glutamate--ammonia ligase]-adenylyl-L-tyrosine phosphorylase/[glutamate--ammonia-ligase] adenylyltransferase [Chthoniobacterales bacterium]